ncbi:MAG: aconitate hydratase [Candidatus Rokubacteria bacterium]|nr:aconitate hydratase [Candidatus Rokubacteria bacterium]MBI3826497.1 aconitate hydratase [Candidatus Rokubacteria bacterium]
MAGRSLTQKLIESHLVAGKPVAGEEVGISVDQVLLTDTNGTQAWLQFEALGFPRVVPGRVVSYIDHQVFQVDSRNSDDHRYLQTASRKYGATFSKPGNGICHQVHMETFSIPGQSLLGCDSHTVLCGAAGMLAIGAGGLDVAVAMGGGPYFFTMPAVVRVWLTGALRPWVTAKDVILELLRRLSVRGGSGKIFEYAGPGVATLLAAQRMTIANMGAELTLTSSVFPSDHVTKSFLARLGRPDDWRPAVADDDATYDDQIELDLDAIEPLVALPGSPDRVVPVGEVAGTVVEQVMVGSCTNGSWHDMSSVAGVLRGKRVHPSVSFVLFPGSHRILETMAREGLFADLLAAGALVSEPSCGACAGIGHVPAAGTKSLRAFNRNFPGRSGVKDDEIYLCSSVTAAASALTGVITDPRTLGAETPVALPAKFATTDVGFVAPDHEGEVTRGPNIKPAPIGEPVAETLEAPVLIKLGDKVSTDAISPAGAAVLMFRSNVPAIAEFSFKNTDPDFVARARAAGRGVIVGGEIYGQGSSRESAAVAPMYLGVRAVIVKSFARIHRANLINWGIVPLTFDDPAAWETIERDDPLRLEHLRSSLEAGARVQVVNTRTGATFTASCVLTPREREILLSGGILALTRQQQEQRSQAAPAARHPRSEPGRRAPLQ